MRELAMDRYDELYEEIDGFIKGQIDGLEMLWGLDGFKGKLKLISGKDSFIACWRIVDAIAYGEDGKDYNWEYRPNMKIFLIKQPTGLINFRMECKLEYLGYGFSRYEDNKILNGFFKKREEKVLEHIRIYDTNNFELRSKEDLIDVFTILQHSNLKFGSTD